MAVSVFGLLAFTGCFEKPENKAQRELEKSTQDALDRARGGLSTTIADDSEDGDQLQQAKDNLAAAISKNRKAPAVDGAVLAKGNITFAQAQKLHALLQTKSIPITKAANQILMISDQVDSLTTQEKRLQDMVNSNSEQINQLNLIIDGDDDGPGIRKELEESDSELAKFNAEKSELEPPYYKAQTLGSNLQNQANDKLRLADAASGEERVKFSTQGLELQRKSNSAMIQAQKLGNKIELVESNIAEAKPLNEKLRNDLNEIKERIASLDNSPDFIKLESQLKNVSDRLKESKTELSTAITRLTGARSDYVKESEEVIAFLTDAIEEYGKIRSKQLKSAAAERIATSYFWIGSVCSENIALAMHAKSILPESTSGYDRIIGNCNSDKKKYGERAFENYDLASEKYGQLDADSERACYIIKQQILTLNGKIEVAEATLESDISGKAADLLDGLLEKARECDPDFSKTLTARLVSGNTNFTPVLAVDNTSYYEDIRKLYQDHAWPKLPIEDRENMVNMLLADLEKLEAEDTFDRLAYERILGPEKLKLENALKRGFEDIIDDGISDPNF